MTYLVEVGDRKIKVEARASGKGTWLVRVDGGPERVVSGGAVAPAEWLLWVDGHKRQLGLHLSGEQVHAQIDGYGLRARVVDARRAALEMASGKGQGEVRTQMPGAIVRVPVEAGTSVRKGQVLIVVEAMKMENEFKSPIDGVVRLVHVEVAQRVEAGAVLVTVDPA